jgi:DNA repair ATPase RecN
MKDLMEVRKQEETRIAREMDKMDERVETLLQKSEENSRGLHTFEEAKKIDARRISDLQSESTELRMKLDTVRGKQDSLEDRIRRAESRVDEIASIEASRKEIYALWEEKQELRMVEFEKVWRGWQTTFDAFRKKADEVDDKILKYDENYRALTKARSELDKLIERLERRITEVSEMQRIGEERSKQEWASFQADQQKRWNTYKLTNDEMWREHGRTHEKLNDDLHLMNEQLSECIEALEDLNEKTQHRVMDLLNIIKVWADEIEKRVSEVR